ncbi:violaxanthin de-epoxidase, chloroplastic [Tanacetum coccineum]
MVSNCGRQVLNCLLDPNCRKALQCLNQCSPVDQVCNYQCLASYESPTLEEFSLCVLQKHNCLDLDAKIPEKPFVPPMVKFQDKILSHEIAEDLFVGWLANLDWSWRAVASQNPAYNQFSCQYQLFYRGKTKGSFWYEPVFQVKTLDGKLVWRRRKYRVKRGKVAVGVSFIIVVLQELRDSLIQWLKDVGGQATEDEAHNHGLLGKGGGKEKVCRGVMIAEKKK